MCRVADIINEGVCYIFFRECSFLCHPTDDVLFRVFLSSAVDQGFKPRLLFRVFASSAVDQGFKPRLT